MRQFEILLKTRQYLLNEINDLTVEQLNEIPAGFNNNIIWNVGHMLAAQLGVCYKRPGIKQPINDKYFDAYKPGTKPEKFIDADEIVAIKKQFIDAVSELETNYNNDVFTDFASFTNRYGFEHRNINDSINFILYHEGVHFGVITSMKKIIKKGNK